MHRFFVFDERALRAGAPIVLGWVGHPPPSKRSKFPYQFAERRRGALTTLAAIRAGGYATSRRVLDLAQTRVVDTRVGSHGDTPARPPCSITSSRGVSGRA